MKKVEVLFKTSIFLGNKSYKKGEKCFFSEKDAQLYVNKGFVECSDLTRKFKNKKTEFNKILITGGIGDWLAIQSFLPEMEIKKIYFATRSFDVLCPFINLFYPKVEMVSLWNDWRIRDCFYQKAEFENVPNDWDEVKDLSILRFFPEVRQKIWKYQGFKFLDIKLNVELPEKFVVVVPDSGNKYGYRDFNDADWEELIKFLNENDLFGVVLRKGKKLIKKNKKIVDLSNLTDLKESIAIMQKAIGYVGIDSCLSVIATKLNYSILKIKTNNKHLIDYKDVYYAPKSDFNFLDDKIVF